ncbi:MAG: FHA domain-containing protein [Luteolibacter sp.]
MRRSLDEGFPTHHLKSTGFHRAGVRKLRAIMKTFAVEKARTHRLRAMPRVTITVPEKNAQPYRFQLDRDVVSLGRGSENDIAIDSGSVSVHHAEMHRIEGGYELRDVGSTNGIKLDGVRYETIPLRSGASVHIGDVAFDFLLSDEENTALALEGPPKLPPLAAEPERELPPKPQAKAATYAEPKSSGSPLATAVMFLILAALAFFTGLAVRYQKDTGGSLIRAIQEHSAMKSTPAPLPSSK